MPTFSLTNLMGQAHLTLGQAHLTLGQAHLTLGQAHLTFIFNFFLICPKQIWRLRNYLHKNILKISKKYILYIIRDGRGQEYIH